MWIVEMDTFEAVAERVSLIHWAQQRKTRLVDKSTMSLELALNLTRELELYVLNITTQIYNISLYLDYYQYLLDFVENSTHSALNRYLQETLNIFLHPTLVFNLLANH
jgi:hypothetical protein